MLKFDIKSDDNLALRTWHYPIINDSDRYYQQRIIESSLKKNTLVCLPTGLGKTFIGLVVMYNFHRWFPSRKLLFMAPTRPLVNQQFQSWNQQFSKQFNINAIEITGGMGPEKRHNAWNTHELFFTTPQVLENDIANNIIEKKSIACLIIDEAHKAVGNYAYCSIVKMLSESNIKFRICALTATPGSSVSSIQSLIYSLKIEQIEYLSESSDDIKPFVSHRTREVIVIPNDPVIDSVKVVLDDIIRRFYLFPLKNLGVVLNFDLDLIYIAALPVNQYKGAVEGYISGLRVMIHLRDLLIFYGINSMLSYLKSLESEQITPLKSRIRKQLLDSESFQQVLMNLKNKMLSPGFLSHPKLGNLGHILLQHFSNPDSNSDTRAMVFSNYRESVTEICHFLQNFSSRLRPVPLLGQSSTNDSNRLNKLNQQNTIEKFMNGIFNIVVSTCIGEEGLDMGFVDLIVFYDAHSSPIRLVQRSGRTGRQRDGKIIVLANEKREKSMLDSSESSLRMIENVMMNSKKHFKFENQTLNSINIASDSIQIVKFKLTNTVKRERSGHKRSLFYTPHNLPSVAELNPRNSIFSYLGPHGAIGHSSSTEALAAIMIQSAHKGLLKKKLLIWKQGLKSMPIFKIFDYQKNDTNDYEFFYDILRKDEPKNVVLDELPDNFFEQEDFDLMEDVINFDINSNSQKSLNLDIDESVFDEFDWSAPEF